jgi:hypothetical protein
LAEERIELGDRWFRQEYYLEFVDTIDSVFTDFDKCFVDLPEGAFF